MLQKYTTVEIYAGWGESNHASTDYYLASDVEAEMAKLKERIAELEKDLKQTDDYRIKIRDELCIRIEELEDEIKLKEIVIDHNAIDRARYRETIANQETDIEGLKTLIGESREIVLPTEEDAKRICKEMFGCHVSEFVQVFMEAVELCDMLNKKPKAKGETG